eukprot:Skav211939  [mRNA]  locus=scaffold1086:614185:618354:- [translate_table: standard]
MAEVEAQEQSVPEEITDMQEVVEDGESASNAGESTAEIASEPVEIAANGFGLAITAENFGVNMDLLQLSQSELFALGRSFELMLAALGGDRDRAGDAIYGAKTTQLIAVKDSFVTPRAVLSLALFNGFRVLGHKSENPEELRLFVETMAFKHLGQDIRYVNTTFGERLKVIQGA